VTPPGILGSTYVAALRGGLLAIMESDERVHLIGEDLLDPYGGAFGVSRDLSTKFPDRVLATPISEACITGLGVGMALGGLRPIVEIMFGDFMTLTADQLINVAAKLRQMYANQVIVPLVVRTPMGGGRGYGPTHSQTLDHLFLGVPNFHVVAPSQFHDPGVLLSTAVLKDEDPVLFSEHKLLYPRQILANSEGELLVTELPGVNGYPTAVVRNYNSGDPDVAVICYGGQAVIVEDMMKRLQDEEIRIIAVIPGSVQPIPTSDLVESLRGVNSILVLEEGPAQFGWGAEVAATIETEMWKELAMPVVRMGARDMVIPASRPMEDEVLPTIASVEARIMDMVSCSL
jgi:acetoin:2,6-dichlorophenolindophenol oxidoreductase subunit beta